MRIEYGSDVHRVSAYARKPQHFFYPVHVYSCYNL